jgi:hypothetical protein
MTLLKLDLVDFFSGVVQAESSDGNSRSSNSRRVLSNLHL